MVRRQLMLFPIATLVYVVVGLFSFVYADEMTSMSEQDMPVWVSEGTATTSFSVKTPLTPEAEDMSDFKKITLTSSRPIDGSISAPYSGMIEMMLTGSGETTFTLLGLEPETEYHRYVNHYGNHTSFITDKDGTYTFTLDITDVLFVYIQNVPSTIFITNDETGGECTQVGEWSVETKTCTLMSNVSETIQIGNDIEGSADGVRLDGNGYLISGSNSGTGVYVYNAHNVSLQNVHVERFATGVGIINSANIILTDIQTDVYNTALSVSYSEHVSIYDSSFNATNYGLLLWSAQSVTLERLTVETYRATLASIRDSSIFTLSNITGNSSTGGGVYVRNSTEGLLTDISVSVRRTSAPFSLSAETGDQLQHTVTDFTANDLPVYYYYAKENEVFDGKGAVLFNLYCASCKNITIKNYTFPTYSNGGIRLLGSEGVVIENNTFNAPTMPLYLTGNTDITVRSNTFFSAAALVAVNRIGSLTAESDALSFYHNSSKSNSPPVRMYSEKDNIVLSQPLPIGGNHWDDYDEADEGCEDANEDMICDTPYSPPNSYDITFTDVYPWISPDAWNDIENPDGLSLPIEGRYEQQRGVVAPGPHPERGYPDNEVFTFKVVYTDSTNTGPESIEVRVAGLVLPMTVDQNADDPLLQDGDYTNGEQFVATSTIPKGMHVYEFHAITEGKTYELITKSDSADLLTCTAGYSSVAFVPGIQSSRLFQDGLVFENQLWEPNIDGDARKLALNEDATPLHEDIYTKPGTDGVIDEALGVLTNIYKSFLNDLDSWKNDEHIIADYAVLPYDWRFAYETVLGSGVVDDDGKLWYGPMHATDTPYMYEELRKLAETSDSGRIFLVGHSMGGLMIKKMLADMEDDESHPYRSLLGKVDNVALVATPQLGTPKAVASLLHGIEQGLSLFDLPFGQYHLITKETARILGNGLPSAYTLLPSKMYFDRVNDVNPEGEEGSYTELIINGDCPTANDYESMLACFATASTTVDRDDLITPLKPRDEYVEYAEKLHDRLDSWVPPDMNSDGDADFTVTQIAGWGVSTISAIEYKEKERVIECPDTDPSSTPQTECYEGYMDPQPSYTFDGDSTVVTPSAVAVSNLNTFYFDMFKYNQKSKVTHATILEASTLRNVIKNITENKNETTNNPDYIHANYSELQYPEAYMRLALHSPVDIEVQSGEYRVGKRELPDGGIVYDAGIPNSYYDKLGEGKYVGFPINNEERTVTLTGTATGTFTFELKLVKNGKIAETKTFTDVPITTNTKVKLAFNTMEDIETLPVDTDGDGVVDTEIYPDGTSNHQVTYDDLIDALQELTVPYTQSLIRRVQVAQRFDEQNKILNAKLVLHSVEQLVTRLSSHRLSKKWRIPEDEKIKILNIISKLEVRYE